MLRGTEGSAPPHLSGRGQGITRECGMNSKLPAAHPTGIALTYNLRYLRQTRNYYVFEYARNDVGTPFQIYIDKADLIDQPLAALAQARMTVEF